MIHTLYVPYGLIESDYYLLLLPFFLVGQRIVITALMYFKVRGWCHPNIFISYFIRFQVDSRFAKKAVLGNSFVYTFPTLKPSEQILCEKFPETQIFKSMQKMGNLPTFLNFINSLPQTHPSFGRTGIF